MDSKCASYLVFIVFFRNPKRKCLQAAQHRPGRLNGTHEPRRVCMASDNMLAESAPHPRTKTIADGPGNWKLPNPQFMTQTPRYDWTCRCVDRHMLLR